MNEQRAQDALRHLQAAALEMIEATRAALELVEDAVKDPNLLAGLVAAAQSMAGVATRPSSGPNEADERDAPAGSRAGRPGQSGVTRIHVS